MKNNGFVALTTVLVVSLVLLVLTTTVAYSSINEAQSGLFLSTGEGNLHFVEGCMEDALLKSRASSSYTGGTITRPEGNCTITVSKVSTVWTITATTTATTFRRTVQAVVNRLTSGITISSWKEL